MSICAVPFASVKIECTDKPTEGHICIGKNTSFRRMPDGSACPVVVSHYGLPSGIKLPQLNQPDWDVKFEWRSFICFKLLSQSAAKKYINPAEFPLQQTCVGDRKKWASRKLQSGCLVQRHDHLRCKGERCWVHLPRREFHQKWAVLTKIPRQFVINPDHGLHLMRQKSWPQRDTLHSLQPTVNVLAKSLSGVGNSRAVSKSGSNNSRTWFLRFPFGTQISILVPVEEQG